MLEGLATPKPDPRGRKCPTPSALGTHPGGGGTLLKKSPGPGGSDTAGSKRPRGPSRGAGGGPSGNGPGGRNGGRPNGAGGAGPSGAAGVLLVLWCWGGSSLGNYGLIRDMQIFQATRCTNIHFSARCVTCCRKKNAQKWGGMLAREKGERLAEKKREEIQKRKPKRDEHENGMKSELEHGRQHDISWLPGPVPLWTKLASGNSQWRQGWHSENRVKCTTVCVYAPEASSMQRIISRHPDAARREFPETPAGWKGDQGGQRVRRERQRVGPGPA